ncbi:hypothetical protein AL755_00160 (plasmid) [Arthrobacter sp. ERGS1:01]|uniref:tripartite tricarboxylate transporter TctB family protein n=1 Tax=Arthrobacter sp. ERGS1:01 TaxID=1704044 RepID=UPI0006B4FDE2|nr:tripartite tricarboxylate transporter TctB family protein [Arthrobacter sp. ERGS1:01]ALE04179.1 hypothetical protein AL755_00160 [Arthrobacter sp. ERGS1:01]
MTTDSAVPTGGPSASPALTWTTDKSRISGRQLRELAGTDSADATGRLDGLRVAPMLVVQVGKDGRRVIAVGNMRVLVHASSLDVKLEATFAALWQEQPTPCQFTSVSVTMPEAEPLMDSVLQDVLAPVLAHDRDDNDPDQHHSAARAAKALAESSRNAVAELREIRYQIELQLVASGGSDSSSLDHTSVVEALLQLNIVCSRAADQAREAIREGLWVHVTDSPAYHAYRRLQDASITNPADPATPETATWMRLHDAGMRQCVELKGQLGDESSAIRDLLTSAASISSSREADAQSRFTVLLAVISIAFGVPALVLALYGADLIMPLSSWPRAGAFGVALLGLCVAAVITARTTPKGEHRRKWQMGTAAIIGTIFLLVAAGLLPLFAGAGM